MGILNLLRRKRKPRITAKTRKALAEAGRRKAEYAQRRRDLDFKRQELIVIQEEAKVQLEMEKIRTQQLQNELRQAEINEKLQDYRPDFDMEDVNEIIEDPESAFMDKALMGILGGMANAKSQQNTGGDHTSYRTTTQSYGRDTNTPRISVVHDPTGPTINQTMSAEYLGHGDGHPRSNDDTREDLFTRKPQGTN